MASRLDTRASGRNDIMTEPKRTSLILILIVVAMVAAIAFTESRASGSERDNSSSSADASADAASIASAVATGGVSDAVVNSSTRAYAFSGGDMDIRDCIATHAVLFGLWQGTHINKPCVALRMDAVGKYEEAAKMRCSMHSFKRVFGRGQKCIDAVILSEPPEPPEPPVVYEEDDDDDDEDDREYADISARLDAMDAARAANVKRYNQDKAARKRADEEFYEGYIEKFEIMQQSDVCCTTKEPHDNE